VGTSSSDSVEIVTPARFDLVRPGNFVPPLETGIAFGDLSSNLALRSSLPSSGSNRFMCRGSGSLSNQTALKPVVAESGTSPLLSPCQRMIDTYFGRVKWQKVSVPSVAADIAAKALLLCVLVAVCPTEASERTLGEFQVFAQPQRRGLLLRLRGLSDGLASSEPCRSLLFSLDEPRFRRFRLLPRYAIHAVDLP